jgi:hypothetical protein
LLGALGQPAEKDQHRFLQECVNGNLTKELGEAKDTKELGEAKDEIDRLTFLTETYSAKMLAHEKEIKQLKERNEKLLQHCDELENNVAKLQSEARESRKAYAEQRNIWLMEKKLLQEKIDMLPKHILHPKPEDDATERQKEDFYNERAHAVGIYG